MFGVSLTDGIYIYYERIFISGRLLPFLITGNLKFFKTILELFYV